MNREPIEVAVMDKQRVARRAMREKRSITGVPERTSSTIFSADIVDEAFAKLPKNLTQHRVDRPTASEAEGAARPNRPLLGDLATEIAAINRRCEHLADLVRGLDATSAKK